MPVSTTTRPAPRPFQDPESRAAAPTKAKVYFLDGNEIDRYGFYNSGRYTVGEDQKFEYSKQSLIRMIDKWADNVVRAIIYDNQRPGKPEIMRKEYGIWKYAV